MRRIESIEWFIEQQQRRAPRQRARQQHQPSLALRQRQESPPRQVLDTETDAVMRATRVALGSAAATAVGVSLRSMPVPTIVVTRWFQS